MMIGSSNGNRQLAIENNPVRCWAHQISLCVDRWIPLVSLTSAMKVFIDGKFYNERDAKVSVFDHGLLYGDGIFEGIRAYNGRVFRLKEHIDRLFYSAKAILLDIPMSHEKLSKAVVDSCRTNKIRDG